MNKSVTKTPIVPKEMLVPFIIITSLFALWGFANDITNPMVSAFKKVMELDNFEASLIQLAFYGGYFTMALPAAIFVNRYSYKKGVLLGLALYAFGALLFYPAASFESYGFFLASLYILTFGLAFLETTANPYILSMGDEKTATRRLNLAQAFNPLGALAGLIVAQKYILSSLESTALGENGEIAFSELSTSGRSLVRTSDLMIIRDPYVILGIVVLGFFIIIGVLNMPINQHEENRVNIVKSIKRLFKVRRFVGGVIAQAFYVGAQIMCWTYLYQYAESLGISNEHAVNYGIAALIFFIIGRWIGTILLNYINSAKLLCYFSIGAGICILLTIFMVGISGLYALIATSFFMSIMFPTIYGVALEGRGEDAKFGAAFLVMAIVGGALMPALQGLILDMGGQGYNDVKIMGVPEVNFSFILPFLCFIITGLYAWKLMSSSKVN